jgi:hypothetical protein
MKTRKPSFYETLGILLLAAGTAVAADNGGKTAQPVHQTDRATAVQSQYTLPAPHANILTGEIIR